MNSPEMRHAPPWTQGQSFSAPKRPSLKETPLQDSKSSSQNSVSPGTSPSKSAAVNLPIKEKQSRGVFFNSEIPLTELQGLGHIGEVAEEEDSPKDFSRNFGVTQTRLRDWMSKSAQMRTATAVDFHESIKQTAGTIYSEALPLEHTPPPPGFGPTLKVSPRKDVVAPQKTNWYDYSSGTNFTPTPTSNLQFNWEILPDNPKEQQEVKPVIEKKPGVRQTGKLQTSEKKESRVNSPPQVEETKKEFQLQAPPKKGKRAERGQFEAEKVMAPRFQGSLKFYHMKKRFGFITLDVDNSDVFLCEDDIVLSGMNHKQFKDDVVAGKKLRFEFSVKVYQEKNKEKKKAIDIVCLSYV